MSAETSMEQLRAQAIEKSLYEVIAEAFSISMNQVHSELSYQSITQWDSMGHIKLMLALEKNFDVKIDQDKVLDLTSVDNIFNFVFKRQTLQTTSENLFNRSNKENTTIFRGLTNVYFDESRIAFIDTKNGNLYYRGYSIYDLVNHASYEEVAYLLMYGELPNQKVLASFKDKIEAMRKLSNDMIAIIHVLANKQSAVNVLRTLVSALSETLNKLPIEDQGIAIISKIPTVIGAYLSIKHNKTLPEPPKHLSQAAYLLFMLLGKLPDADVVRIFEQNMILQAEHDANASTFSGRVTMSTEAEFGNAITAAIATFSGWLHGGALLGVVQMLEEIKDVSNVKVYVQNRLSKKLPVFGFGHRVYRREDPRAAPLKINAKALAEKYGDDRLLKILEAVKFEMSAYIEHGININVDFYACVSYLLMEIQKDMLVPIFIANRSCGWVAHLLEQKNKNILIRPRLYYIGEKNKKFVTLDQRD